MCVFIPKLELLFCSNAFAGPSWIDAFLQKHHGSCLNENSTNHVRTQNIVIMTAKVVFTISVKCEYKL